MRMVRRLTHTGPRLTHTAPGMLNLMESKLIPINLRPDIKFFGLELDKRHTIR